MSCLSGYIGVPRMVSVEGVLCIDFLDVAANEALY